MKDIQKKIVISIIIITHDLGVVANIADRVAVMYAGNIIETGKVEEVFYNPQPPYTWAEWSNWRADNNLCRIVERVTK